MKVAAVMRDLMFFSRIDDAASRAGASLVRVDDPDRVPSGTDLVLVDWADRADEWASTLTGLRDEGARLVAFGPHTDLEAHAAAKAAGLGPMLARSALLRTLDTVLADQASAPSTRRR